MSKYTVDDFANAQLATSSYGGAACRDVDSSRWYLSNSVILTDEDMVVSGTWTPITSDPSVTFGDLAKAWEKAEIFDKNSPPRTGDTLIERIFEYEFRVWIVPKTWEIEVPSWDCRIIQRAPQRPDGAEKLTDLIAQADKDHDCDATYEDIADWLLENGVKVG